MKRIAKNDSPPIEAKSRKTEHHAINIERPKSRSISELCNLIGGIHRVETADVNFVFDDDGNEELVPVHRCILALHSPVFRRMLYESDLKEKCDIKLTDTTIDAFVDFMQSLYARVFIDGTKSNISPLLYLAHKYDVNWLERRCSDILDGIIYNNVMDIF